jgi:hypothetical protein
VADKVELGQIFLRVLQLSLSLSLHRYSKFTEVLSRDYNDHDLDHVDGAKLLLRLSAATSGSSVQPQVIYEQGELW